MRRPKLTLVFFSLPVFMSRSLKSFFQPLKGRPCSKLSTRSLPPPTHVLRPTAKLLSAGKASKTIFLSLKLLSDTCLEMLLSHDVTLSKDTVLLYVNELFFGACAQQCPSSAWKSPESATAIAKRGYKVIHAESDYFYLDCGHGTWVGQWPDGNSWCDPFKTWQKVRTLKCHTVPERVL